LTFCSVSSSSVGVVKSKLKCQGEWLSQLLAGEDFS
jgi:hypothetical protein